MAREHKASLDEWKGTPLLKIEGDFRPFRINPRKAQAIVALIEEIKKFAADTVDHTLPRWQRKAKAPEPTQEEIDIIAKYIQNPWPRENSADLPAN